MASSNTLAHVDSTYRDAPNGSRHPRGLHQESAALFQRWCGAEHFVDGGLPIGHTVGAGQPQGPHAILHGLAAQGVDHGLLVHLAFEGLGDGQQLVQAIRPM